MSSNSSARSSTGPAGRHPSVRPVVAPVDRTNVEIRTLLQEVGGRTASCTELERRHALAILDDLAEAMIGRSANADTFLKIEIRHQRGRWEDTASTELPTGSTELPTASTELPTGQPSGPRAGDGRWWASGGRFQL